VKLIPALPHPQGAPLALARPWKKPPKRLDYNPVMNPNQRVRKNCARMIEQSVKRISQGKPIEARRLLDAAKQWMDKDPIVYADPRIQRAYSGATAQLKVGGDG
jgi:hypothetical protein